MGLRAGFQFEYGARDTHVVHVAGAGYLTGDGFGLLGLVLRMCIACEKIMFMYFQWNP